MGQIEPLKALIKDGPVKFTQDGLIVDSKNRTIAILTWKSDLDFTRRQEKIASYIVDMVNNELSKVEPELEVEPVVPVEPTKSIGITRWKDILKTR